MKPPIWERQGRPKPPRARVAIFWQSSLRRHAVWRARPGCWLVEAPTGLPQRFPTHAEAIAWADREARKETP